MKETSLRASYLVASVSLFLLTALEGWPAAGDENRDAASAAPLQVTCAPDVPVAHPGQSITLRTWVTDGSGNPVRQPLQYSWRTSTGSVSGGNMATWSIGQATETSGSETRATATVVVKNELARRGTCTLLVYVARPAQSITEGPIISRGLDKGRAFLLPGNDAPDGYGLYSYLLFDTPPKNEQERERFLKAIESYFLILQPLQEMERYRRRIEINIVLLPLKQSVDLPPNLSDPEVAAAAAPRVLAMYDYGRAQHLLSAFGKAAIPTGPFLISTTNTHPAQNQPRLFFDMSHVVPKLVWDWVKTFCMLAAQERTWTDVTLKKLALNIRNVLAVASSETPAVVSPLKDLITVSPPK